MPLYIEIHMLADRFLDQVFEELALEFLERIQFYVGIPPAGDVFQKEFDKFIRQTQS